MPVAPSYSRQAAPVVTVAPVAAAPPSAPPRNHGPSSGGAGRGGDNKTVPEKGPWILFVGNLSYDVQESDLRNEFKDCNPTDVRLLRHKDSDRLKGCFIELPSADDLRRGLAHEGALLRGRALHTDVGEAPRHSGGDRGM